VASRFLRKKSSSGDNAPDQIRQILLGVPRPRNAFLHQGIGLFVVASFGHAEREPVARVSRNPCSRLRRRASPASSCFGRAARNARCRSYRVTRTLSVAFRHQGAGARCRAPDVLARRRGVVGTGRRVEGCPMSKTHSEVAARNRRLLVIDWKDRHSRRERKQAGQTRSAWHVVRVRCCLAASEPQVRAVASPPSAARTHSS